MGGWGGWEGAGKGGGEGDVEGVGVKIVAAACERIRGMMVEGGGTYRGRR